jgi:hypothetical protein
LPVPNRFPLPVGIKQLGKEIKVTCLGDATGFFTLEMSVSRPAWPGGNIPLVSGCGGLFTP